MGIRATQKTTCTGVEMFRKLLDQGQAGDNVGILLRGTKREEVERGRVLAKPGSITPHTHFTAEIYVLSKEEAAATPFFSNYRPQFYFRTTDVTGAVELPKDKEMVMPGDNVSITVKLIAPIAMEEGCASPSAKAAAPWLRRRGQDHRVKVFHRRGIAQLAERRSPKTEGRGSIPLPPATRQSHRTDPVRRPAGPPAGFVPDSKDMATQPTVETVSTGAERPSLAAAALLLGRPGGLLPAGPEGPVAARRRAAGAAGGGGRRVLHRRARQQLIGFGRDSVKEVKKVVWPTRKEALQMTGFGSSPSSS